MGAMQQLVDRRRGNMQATSCSVWRMRDKRKRNFTDAKHRWVDVCD